MNIAGCVRTRVAVMPTRGGEGCARLSIADAVAAAARGMP